MTEESRKRKADNIKKNCGTCCHADVCGWKGKYDTEVGALIHEMQSCSMIQYDMKCKHHMSIHGCTHNLEVSNGEA